jgi:hypothetical protein
MILIGEMGKKEDVIEKKVQFCSVLPKSLFMDVHDSATRSYNMSQIKGKDTQPELLVRKFLFANGFRYRLHDKKLTRKPDIFQKAFNSDI